MSGTTTLEAPPSTAVRRLRGAELQRRFLAARSGDHEARTSLILEFLPLARRLASRYRASSENFEDLVQVANLGLVKAVDRFDPDRAVAFSSFAVPTIVGELKRYFRDTGWAVHVPRALHERALEVDRAQHELEGRLGRSPRVREVAEHLGLTLEVVLEAMEAFAAYDAVSVDAPVRSEDGADTGLLDRLGHEDPALQMTEERATVAATIRSLPLRDRQVLKLRFGADLTQTEIGKRVGVSQMEVSRIIRRSIARLRELAGEDGEPV